MQICSTRKIEVRQQPQFIVETKDYPKNQQKDTTAEKETLLDTLIQPEGVLNFLPYQLRRKRKRKKRNINR